jgi:hypothetical protein
MNVPKLNLETEEQKALFESGRLRYESYRERKKQRKAALAQNKNKSEE